MAKIVNILVHDDVITVSPTIVRARKDEVVRWEAPGADRFVLVFRDGAALAENRSDQYGHGVEVTSIEGKFLVDERTKSPLDAARLDTSGPIAQARIRGEPGVHQYQLAIQKGEKLYLDVGCPEVIID